MNRLSGFCRLILFDKRGIGLSDRDVGESTLEERMDDARAVLDAVGSKTCAVIAVSEGGGLGMLFAATYPERVTQLILFGVSYCLSDDPGYPPGLHQREAVAQGIDYINKHWGAGHLALMAGPAMVQIPDEVIEHCGRYERASASPRAAINHLRWQLEMDLRPVAKSLRVPTLIFHTVGDQMVPVGSGRWLAENVPGAQYVELQADYHLPWFEPETGVVDAIEEFITGERGNHEDRVLATVMFTDIVGSTERAAAMGDQSWRGLLDQHHATVRKELTRFRGKEIDTAGDGFLAAFDGPARAIKCATAIRDAVKPLGIEVRAGVHTGECERHGEKLAGIAVHTGARVLSCAGPSEVWVSGTVRDLVAGSGLNFEDRGTRALKGIPGEWRLFAVA
jgi:class 3 adenylate cyclase